MVQDLNTGQINNFRGDKDRGMGSVKVKAFIYQSVLKVILEGVLIMDTFLNGASDS